MALLSLYFSAVDFRRHNQTTNNQITNNNNASPSYYLPIDLKKEVTSGDDILNDAQNKTNNSANDFNIHEKNVMNLNF